jgi:hypothetical protein
MVMGESTFSGTGCQSPIFQIFGEMFPARHYPRAGQAASL